MTPHHEDTARDRRAALREIGAATRLLATALASAGMALVPSAHRGQQQGVVSAQPGTDLVGGLPAGILAADDHLRRAVKALRDHHDPVAALHEAGEAYEAVDVAWGELVAGRALQQLADHIATYTNAIPRRTRPPATIGDATGELLAAYTAYRSRQYLSVLQHIERGHIALHRPARDTGRHAYGARTSGPLDETLGEATAGAEHRIEAGADHGRETGLG
jgi:hypothetical protein